MFTDSDVDYFPDTIILKKVCIRKKKPFGVTFDVCVRSFQTNVAFTKVKLMFLFFESNSGTIKLQVFLVLHQA